MGNKTIVIVLGHYEFRDFTVKGEEIVNMYTDPLLIHTTCTASMYSRTSLRKDERDE